MGSIVTRSVGTATVIKIIVRVFFPEIAENRYLLIFGIEWITTLQFLPSYF
jgi:hypothetical protein